MHAVLTEILLLLAAAVFAVPLFRRFGLGAVAGYLFAGVLIGPSFTGLISDVTRIQSLSELGVVLLLFVIGLELQPSRLWVLRRPVFGLGSLQVVVQPAVWRPCCPGRPALAGGTGGGRGAVAVIHRRGVAGHVGTARAHHPARTRCLCGPAVPGSGCHSWCCRCCRAGRPSRAWTGCRPCASSDCWCGVLAGRPLWLAAPAGLGWYVPATVKCSLPWRCRWWSEPPCWPNRPG